MKKRILSLLLILCMAVTLLPTAVFAKVVVPKGQAQIGNTMYGTLDEALQAAQDNDTIYLGEGTYSGNAANPTVQGKGAGKNLTFVGAGTDKTKWEIQATQQYGGLGGDGWCDYSFQGSDRITFENMTVVGSVYPDGSTQAKDTQGLTYINHITLKNCIFNGRADYWGYKSTTFEGVTFNAPGTAASGVKSGNYSLWTYTGENYTFKSCTFNSQSGKTVNVYRHGGPDYDVIVNFEDCTFNTESHWAYAYPNPVNINDSTLNSAHKYVINFTGNTKTNGFSPIELTCSRLFCFGADLKGTKNNTGKTDVNFGGTTVWQDGKMVDAETYHNEGVTVNGVSYNNGVAGANDSLYAEGYKDNAFTITPLGESTSTSRISRSSSMALPRKPSTAGRTSSAWSTTMRRSSTSTLRKTWKPIRTTMMPYLRCSAPSHARARLFPLPTRPPRSAPAIPSSPGAAKARLAM